MQSLGGIGEEKHRLERKRNKSDTSEKEEEPFKRPMKSGSAPEENDDGLRKQSPCQQRGASTASLREKAFRPPLTCSLPSALTARKMPTQPIKSAEEYDSVTQGGTVVVTFFATWNGPSRQIKPFVEEQSNKKEYSDMRFFLVDADECPELAEREDVSSMPTLKIYRNGKCIHNLPGANQAAADECIKKLV
ncbi:hypothetical protein Esti_000170 [Eimeria stiedai]